MDILDRLQREEELEGLWHCLASALRSPEPDRVGVAFWCEEAEQQGLEVPSEVATALMALRSEEAGRLAHWEQESSMSARAADAHKCGDVDALREMALDAHFTGRDPSAATAALAALAHAGRPHSWTPREPEPFAALDADEEWAQAFEEFPDGLPAGSSGSSSSSCGLQGQQAWDVTPGLDGWRQPGTSSSSSQQDLPEKLYVNSPNGQTSVFGMYCLESGILANGFSVWCQVGGERWLYTDQLGRWNIGSRKVREMNFACNMGFVYSPEHKGLTPDKVPRGSWHRWDDGLHQWCRDDTIIVSERFEEYHALDVIDRGVRRRKQAGAKGGGRCGRSGGRGAGRGGEKGGRGTRPVAGTGGRATAQKSSTCAGPKGAGGQAGHGASIPPRQPPPSGATAGGTKTARPRQMTRGSALRCLGFTEEKFPSGQKLRHAYRQAALRWHPDRRQNHGREAQAKQRFQDVRDAFELLKGGVDPLKLLMSTPSGPPAEAGPPAETEPAKSSAAA